MLLTRTLTRTLTPQTTTPFFSLISRQAGTMSSATHNDPADPSRDKRSTGTEPHQHQAGSTTHRPEDQWKFRPPYRLADDAPSFDAKWRGHCHCGAVRYEISRERPLASKYCHCTTCQRLHGAPFQWAAIFEKTDVRFTSGHHDLGWYDAKGKKTSHTLPCKVACAYCRTPVMDEGRRMVLLFPTLVEGVNTEEGREKWKAGCHMFYGQRVVDVRDGLEKWEGMQGESRLVDEVTGEVVEEKEEKEEEKEGGEGGDKKRRKTEGK